MSTDSKYYQYNPEKRNIFIEINQGRTNYFKEFILSFFLFFASYGSAVVEVFLRRRFGERYITFAQSLTIFVFLSFFYPLIVARIQFWIYQFQAGIGARPDFPDTPSYVSTMVFMLMFLAMSVYHRLEIKRYGTTYDFKRFSLSDGEIHPLWWKIIGREFFGMRISHYTVRVLLEPLVPIIIGIILAIIPATQPTGALLFNCGLLFMARNFNKAQMGRDWVLDNIDKKISNEMKYDVFIGQKPMQETKGIYLPIELPGDESVRQSLYNMVEDSFSGTNDIWENDYLDEIADGGDTGGGKKSNTAGVRGGLNTDGGRRAGNGVPEDGNG